MRETQKTERHTHGRRRALGDRILALRDRLLCDPAFQRWAARFPLTRPIARRQARAAFDLCAGFVYSQALHAIVRLGILDHVKAGPKTEEALLRCITLPEANARLLIDAAIALGLLSRRSGGRIGIGMHGCAVVANPGIGAMIDHHALLYADLTEPVGLLEGRRSDARLAAFWPYSGSVDARSLGNSDISRYSELMTRSQGMLADDIVDTYPFAQHRSILDVGGGEGEFLLTLARRIAGPSLHLFDLPAVAARAADRVAAAGFSHRIGTTGGSFLADDLPQGHDAVTLVRIVHDHDDARVLTLFSRIRRTLPRGGTLIIAEPLQDTPDADRVANVYFAFYLLAMGRGRPRSAAEIRRLLEISGFRNVRLLATPRPMLVSVLVATNEGEIQR